MAKQQPKKPVESKPAKVGKLKKSYVISGIRYDKGTPESKELVEAIKKHGADPSALFEW